MPPPSGFKFNSLAVTFPGLLTALEKKGKSSNHFTHVVLVVFFVVRQRNTVGADYLPLSFPVRSNIKSI